MSYVMGFVTPVATDRRDDYADFARRGAALFAGMGAGRTVDALGDDVPAGKVNDLAGAVQLRDGEVVAFGFMEFASKADANAFNAQVMTDPRVEALGEMPFDGKRMIYGGFEVMMDRGTGGGGSGYLDGFVLSVPADGRDAYRAMAEQAAAVFLDHGVTRIVEAWGLDVPHGEVTDFYRATHARDGEIPVFSWCEWPDKEARERGKAAMEADPRMREMPADLPFDGQRMIFGGFTVVSDR